MTRISLFALAVLVSLLVAPMPVVASPGALVDDLARATVRVLPRAGAADDLARLGLRETAERVAARHGDEAVDALASWAARHGDDLTRALRHPVGEDAAVTLLRAVPEGQLDDAIRLLARSHADDALTRTLRMHGDEGLRFALANPHRGARVLGAVDVTTGRAIMRVWSDEQVRVASAMLHATRANGPATARTQRMLNAHGTSFIDFVRTHRLWIAGGAGGVLGVLALHEVSEITEDFERTVRHASNLVTSPAVITRGSLADRILDRVMRTALIIGLVVAALLAWFARPWIGRALRARRRALRQDQTSESAVPESQPTATGDPAR